MKHHVTTRNTQLALAESLKKFMEKKPLSKITVSEIAADCGVNRKTFYYHFDDIYALLKWMLEEEAINVVRQFDLLVDYREAFLFVSDYVNANKHLLACAYDSIGRDEMKRFFYADFIGIVTSVIATAEHQIGLHVNSDFKTFLAHFYTEALAGLLIDEFTDNKEKLDPEKTIEYLSLIFKKSLPNILTSSVKEKKNSKKKEPHR